MAPSQKSQQPSSGSGGATKVTEESALAVAVVIGLGFVWWRWGGGEHIFAQRIDVLGGDVHTVLPKVVAFGILLVLLAIGFAVLLVRRWWRRRIARQVLRCFHEMKIATRKGEPPKLKVFRRRGRWVYEMAFRMPPTVSSRLMAQIQPNLQESLDCGVKVWADKGLMWFRIGTHKMPERILYRDFRGEVEREHGELPVAVGVSREGPLLVDLAEVPHLLVGGTTGGGKSVFLNNLIVTLIRALPPERLELVLVDLKGGLEFWRYRQLLHLLCPVVCDTQGFASAMGVVAAELEHRYPIFRDEGAEQLKTWNRMHPDRRQPYIVVIVDELAEATVKAGSADQEEQLRRKQTVALLSTVGRMGRALGIHLVLCTQRPDADVLPGQIKGQMGATIAFRARDFVQSEVLLGQGDVTAAMLAQEAKGRAYYKGSEEGVMVQTPLVTPEEADAIVRRIVEEAGGREASGSLPAPVQVELVSQSDTATIVPAQNSTPEASRDQPRKRPRAYDIARLRVGVDYELELRDGRSVRGTVRATAYPQGEGGANADGEHPLWLQGEGRDHWLSPYEIASVRRCPPAANEKTTEEERSA